MQQGGKRLGAGRKKGGHNKATLEKAAIMEAFNQRVMTHAERLFQAQLALSVGSVQIFRVDIEEDDKGKPKRVHTLVTDPDEIKEVLDENDGGAGTVGDNYYFVTDVAPQNAAIESMFNRVFGKPKESIDLNTTINDPESNSPENICRRWIAAFLGTNIDRDDGSSIKPSMEMAINALSRFRLDGVEDEFRLGYVERERKLIGG